MADWEIRGKFPNSVTIANRLKANDRKLRLLHDAGDYLEAANAVIQERPALGVLVENEHLGMIMKGLHQHRCARSLFSQYEHWRTFAVDTKRLNNPFLEDRKISLALLTILEGSEAHLRFFRLSFR